MKYIFLGVLTIFSGCFVSFIEPMLWQRKVIFHEVLLISSEEKNNP